MNLRQNAIDAYNYVKPRAAAAYLAVDTWARPHLADPRKSAGVGAVGGAIVGSILTVLATKMPSTSSAKPAKLDLQTSVWIREGKEARSIELLKYLLNKLGELLPDSQKAEKDFQDLLHPEAFGSNPEEWLNKAIALVGNVKTSGDQSAADAVGLKIQLEQALEKIKQQKKDELRLRTAEQGVLRNRLNDLEAKLAAARKSEQAWAAYAAPTAGEKEDRAMRLGLLDERIAQLEIQIKQTRERLIENERRSQDLLR